MAKRKKKEPPQEPEFDPTSNANYVRSHGRRMPHWRWESIVGKVQSASRDLKIDKLLYDQAARFHSLLNETNTQQLARQYPNLYEAWYIFTQEEDLRWYLEAMIVAKSEVATIAEELELELETVKFYEYLFFDVRTHKGNFYFLNHCLGGAARGAVDKTNLDTTLKLLGIHGGMTVVRDFLSLGLSPVDATQFYQDAIRSQQKKNHLMAEAGRTVNRFTERHIAEQAIEQQKLDLIAQQAGLLSKSGQETDIGAVGLMGLGMSIATFTPELVNRTPESEQRAMMQVVAALNRGTMNSVEPASPSSASKELPQNPTQESSRGPDGP